MTVALRRLDDDDLDDLFEWGQDPRAVEMAAFTHADPSDRAAFDAHHERIRSNPTNTLLAIDDGDGLVGTVGSYTMDDDREITYWIDPARWGEGLATAALKAFLDVEKERPLLARVAEHNVGSATVLVRAGFEQIGSETGYAEGVGCDVVAHVYRLGR